MGLLHGARAEFSAHHRTEALQLLRLLHIPVRYICTRYRWQIGTRQSRGSVPLVYESEVWFCSFLLWLLNFKMTTKNKVFPVLRIRELYPGSEFFHPGSEFFHPGSWVIQVKVNDPKRLPEMKFCLWWLWSTVSFFDNCYFSGQIFLKKMRLFPGNVRYRYCINLLFCTLMYTFSTFSCSLNSLVIYSKLHLKTLI
jgi:hypothetical protein